jgi:hypothetical protein
VHSLVCSLDTPTLPSGSTVLGLLTRNQPVPIAFDPNGETCFNPLYLTCGTSAA